MLLLLLILEKISFIMNNTPSVAFGDSSLGEGAFRLASVILERCLSLAPVILERNAYEAKDMSNGIILFFRRILRFANAPLEDDTAEGTFVKR